MPAFSELSRARLATCHPDLIKLFERVVLIADCTVICGHRGEAEQEAAFRSGFSKVRFPASKHNASPSLAADVIPYPIDWSDRRRFYLFAGIVRGVAGELGIPIRLGADWDGDLDLKDQNFHDLPHFELKE